MVPGDTVVERAMVGALDWLAVIEAKGTAVGFVEKRGEMVGVATELVLEAVDPETLEVTVPEMDDGAEELELGVLELGVPELGVLALVET